MKFPDLRGTRPAIHVETLVLATSIFLLAVMNAPFWSAALRGRSWGEPATWAFMAAMFGVFVSAYFIAAALLSTRHTVKPLLSILIVVTAVCAYYIDRYSVYFDRAMLRNVLATNYKEARELVGLDLITYVLLFGLLPATLVWWPRLDQRPLKRALGVRVVWLTGAIVILAASLLFAFADLASLMRNHKEVRHLLTPGNVIAASAGNVWGRAKRPNVPKTVVGGDAKLDAAIWQTHKRPTLFVLVVGETARAQNFSLNGYARETNPELAKRNVVNFPQTEACGTSTEVSLPCMFSPFGRRNYDEEKILTHESFLHVLKRAGIDVLWRDNQSGCKSVCEGLPVQQLDHAGVDALCSEGQCLDEILVHGMDGVLRDAKGNLFVVMHQLGSHGPAYFKRYPALFKRFTPACETDELRLCSPGDIRNAYDNSLLYTDFFLSRVIDFLDSAQKTHDTAMLYVSDHGESLGEGGLYLHGVPYAIAPDVQKKVPMVVWLSPAFQRSFQVDVACLKSRAARPASHDNLFHSVLGVLAVRTSAYDASMDVFAPCRTAAGAAVKPQETPR
ncbi:phosphoethanolamine--lipid A transferase [Caenimonas koreensis DSM 17982]|uniref:Phosphoethanolamine--lipid A transferase n=1 Tax=Caenimonas koreensis DSM 17982 TaxID=1121255 RepID=A0A844B621_9BURK|nr:phosphoethanolamine--lipid A transferase [Caenimonas koreensis]MRD45991.1 phosphoethanolamine--lipid A transferase [Caenimonas koreensis DSM 17982]